MKDLSKVNLNLLVALDALLTQCHVTRAGEKIGLSQSAMSSSLKKLRSIYQDDLLIRGQGSSMMLTPFAKELRTRVKDLLNQCDTVLAGQQQFEPSSSTHIFTIGMSDYIAALLMPKLIKQVRHVAPNVQIRAHPIAQMNTAKPLSSGELDVAIGQFDAAPMSLMQLPLFTDHAVCVADYRHPAFRSEVLTLEEYTSYPQVALSTFTPHLPNEHAIAKALRDKPKPKFAVEVAYAAMALSLLPDTDLMTTTLSRSAEPVADVYGLAIRKPPFELPQFQARLYWHRAKDHDPANQWLRSLIVSLLRE